MYQRNIDTHQQFYLKNSKANLISNATSYHLSKRDFSSFLKIMNIAALVGFAYVYIISAHTRITPHCSFHLHITKASSPIILKYQKQHHLLMQCTWKYKINHGASTLIIAEEIKNPLVIFFQIRSGGITNKNL